MQQDAFMVVAPLRPGQEETLRALLAGMTTAPGIADPGNALLPFGAFETLHFSRFVILHDQTLDDLAAYGMSWPDAPVHLAFLGDCDGPAEAMLAAFAARAAPGLRQIFAFCQGFDAATDLLDWMRAHAVRPAAMYVNWVGRTVRQVREEAALHQSLRAFRAAEESTLCALPPQQARARMLEHVARERAAGRLMLTRPEPPRLGLGDVVQALAVPLLPLALVLLLPWLVLPALAVFLVLLRRHERADLEIAPPPTPAHVRSLAEREDHEVTNQFSALGSVKPGLFRRATLAVLLAALDWSTRFVYTRGRLSRVGTIHFARWVYLDGGRRLFFGSNYDGSLDSYMDDFINKVAWGLNLVFSNGIGYPRTDFLILRGAKAEQAFKHYSNPPPPVADRGLVQGLSWPHCARPRAQRPDPPRLGTGRDERRRGAALAYSDLAEVRVMRPPADEQADIQALVHTGWPGLDAACFVLLEIADAEAVRLAERPACYHGCRPGTAAGRGAAGGVRRGGAGRPRRPAGRAVRIFPRVRRRAWRCQPCAPPGRHRDERSRRLALGPRYRTASPAAALRPRGRPRHVVRAHDRSGAGGGLRVLHTLQAGSGGRGEPFGFADGISQPVTDWDGTRDRDGYDYRNLIAPGEFVLGYENEYGQYTERPLLPAESDPAGLLPQAAEDQTRRDLGRNGSYLVFRQLAQDVDVFWRFLDGAAGGDRAWAILLAEALVGGTWPARRCSARAARASPASGRRRTTLRPTVSRTMPTGRGSAVRWVRMCAAPTRATATSRAAARTRRPGWSVGSLGFAGSGPRDDVIASSRFHRILRRSRPYGGEHGETGLHFICLNANIARQFEFVQNAWLNSPTFDGRDGEADPLLGSREPLADGRATGLYSLPQPNGVRRCIGDLPRFVTVRGGGYFFLPGLRALRFLTQR